VNDWQIYAVLWVGAAVAYFTIRRPRTE